MDVNIAVVVTLLIFGVLLWSVFHKRIHGLRVLLYHKVALTSADSLTVSTEQLREQLATLLQKGYTFVSAETALSSQNSPTNGRSVLITFDDGYADLLIYALPVLRELKVPAVFFIPTAYVGGQNEWDGATDALMTADELKQLVSEGFTLAYHSHQHQNYKHLGSEAIGADLTKSVQTANELGLSLVPTLAYPYGGRPKKRSARRAMYQLMQQHGITLAFRIGNRINAWPFSNPYEINRIDVRGPESLKTFLRRVAWGKWL